MLLELVACGAESSAPTAPEAPKYVFLFSGGMSYPHFQSATDYLGAIADPGALPSLKYTERSSVLDGPVELCFMSFAAG